MSLCNAAATFQSLMKNIFNDRLDAVMGMYMYDLQINSRDEESH